MNIFNFFSELKQKCGLPENLTLPYNIVNVGGNIIYIEGQRGILTLTPEVISCKLKKGWVEIKGNGMIVKELTESTIIIQGKIYKLEVF